jgi:hypothetical protein
MYFVGLLNNNSDDLFGIARQSEEMGGESEGSIARACDWSNPEEWLTGATMR